MAFGFSFMKALPWPQGKCEGYAASRGTAQDSWNTSKETCLVVWASYETLRLANVDAEPSKV
jgi:hypothetical protein